MIAPTASPALSVSKNNPKQRNAKVLTTCHRCRKPFKAERCTAAFCSDRCRLKQWRDARKGRRCEYYSPPEVVAAARALLGGIDLDPASCRTANAVVRATKFYSVRDNGLGRPWFGKVWINPPFPWGPWVPKLLAEWQAGNIDAVIALATTRVTTARYFQPLVSASTAVLKMEGRIKFWGPKAASPDDGHEIYYLGPDVVGFERYVSPFGKVFK